MCTRSKNIGNQSQLLKLEVRDTNSTPKLYQCAHKSPRNFRICGLDEGFNLVNFRGSMCSFFFMQHSNGSISLNLRQGRRRRN
jgi:hypothetical protein